MKENNLYCKQCNKTYEIGDTIEKGNKCTQCHKRLIKL